MALPGVYKIFNDNWAKHTVWLYSDPHFSDEELQLNVTNRPDDETQIKMINSQVGKNDTFICLGDVGNIEYIRKIKGYKVLIMGNHDTGKTNYERKIEYKKYPKDSYSREEIIKTMKNLYPNWKINIREEHGFHAPFEWWEVEIDNCLFDEVYEGALIIGEKIILSHEPVNIPWMWNFHGHDHTGNFRENHLNVCSDVIGYKPINLNTFLKHYGISSKIQSIHRVTIDNATKRKQRKKKN